MLKAIIFLLVTLQFIAFGQENWKEIISRDLVTIKQGKMLVYKGVILKTIESKPIYSWQQKQSPKQIRVNIHCETDAKGFISRDNFISFSSMMVYNNLAYFLDSAFIGYIDNNIFFTNVDFTFLEKPFDYPDLEVNVIFDKDNFSITVKSPFLGFERKFSQKWEEFFEKAKIAELQKKEAEERIKQKLNKLLDIKGWKKYTNDEKGISLEYPENWTIRDTYYYDEYNENHLLSIISENSIYEELEFNYYHKDTIAAIILYVFTYESDQDLDSYTDEFYPDYIKINRTFNKIQWAKLSKESFNEFCHEIYLYEKEGTIISLDFVKIGKLENKLDDTIKKMMESLKFVE